ncbi:MAG: nucleotidyltransferase domain-containing protein [Clostridia bacterium]|nr:nucleotidyltransferase domain-containing protein [Clostridia bacterium]
MQAIVAYIKEKYDPLSLIVYGSYANGTNNLNSDFDALVIWRGNGQIHDTACVAGVRLDVFVYPVSFFDGAYSCEDLIRIFDGKILIDTDDMGKNLQLQVLQYLRERPQKTEAEIQCDIDWCVKMCERAGRGDAEGMFRWHWLLVDSLEIFCDAVRQHYFGPKKTLLWMQEKQPTAFLYYEKALKDFSYESLNDWISYIRDLRKKTK